MAKAPFILETQPLSEDAKQLAIKELRETPEIVEESLKKLRELLKGDSTIFYYDDEEFLTIFLRPTKFYAESAFKLMQSIAEFRYKNKNILYNLMPIDEKDGIVKYNIINVLTHRDHLGRRVLLANCGSVWDPDKVSTDQFIRILYLIHLAAMLEPETQVRGAVVIMDYNGFGMKQVKAFSPNFAMKLMSFIQDAMPFRLKEVHIINQPFLFNVVWKVIKPLVREKLNKRIHFHGSKMKSLHEFIPASHLPADYDGDLPKIDYTAKEWYPAIDGYLDHFERWNKCGKK